MEMENKINIKDNIINRINKRVVKLKLSNSSSLQTKIKGKDKIYWQALLIETQKMSQQKNINKIINSSANSNHFA